MRTFRYNLGWFFREAGTIMRMNAVSSLFSVFGTALMLFLFAMTLTVRISSADLSARLEAAAAMDVHLREGLDESVWNARMQEIQGIAGVTAVRLVDAAEAERRMESILGSEADVLSRFEQNPFGAYLEVGVSMDARAGVRTRIETVSDVELVRDNRDVLDRLGTLTAAARWIGWIIVAVVGVTSLVLVSHTVRQGMELHRERIRTMYLLGAPRLFVATPFLITGILLAAIGGGVSAVLSVVAVREGFSAWAGTLPFLPPPEQAPVTAQILKVIPASGAALGLLGSLFGISSGSRNP